MTCLERLWKEHPDLVPKGRCPHEFGYLPEKPWDCYERSCWDCWLQEAIAKSGDEEGDRDDIR